MRVVMMGNIVFLINSVQARKRVVISHTFHNKNEMIREVKAFLDDREIRYSVHHEEFKTIIEKIT